MKTRYAILVILCLSIMSFSADTGRTEKWISLFNGKNLDGWKMKIVGYPLGENFGNTFRVADGVLSVRYDQYPTFDNRFGALYFDKKFTNYRLRVEYRFTGDTVKGAPKWGYRDSGVQYHCQAPSTLEIKQNFPISLEYNLHGGNGKDDRPVGEICANGITVEINGTKNESYCTPASVKRTFHGDQWVTLEIDVRDGVFKHFVNGEEILRYENARYNAANETAKKFIVNADDRVRSGYISLQSNSAPIDFRKVEIMEY